jgi:hypothetical protein
MKAIGELMLRVAASREALEGRLHDFDGACLIDQVSAISAAHDAVVTQLELHLEARAALQKAMADEIRRFRP